MSHWLNHLASSVDTTGGISRTFEANPRCFARLSNGVVSAPTPRIHSSAPGISLCTMPKASTPMSSPYIRLTVPWYIITNFPGAGAATGALDELEREVQSASFAVFMTTVDFDRGNPRSTSRSWIGSLTVIT